MKKHRRWNKNAKTQIKFEFGAKKEETPEKKNNIAKYEFKPEI